MSAPELMKISSRNIPIFAVLATLSGCGEICGNEVQESIASPSGEMKAVVFSRDRGATTGFGTQISILRAQDNLPNEGGNLLVVEGRHSMKPQWKSGHALHIHGPQRSEIFRKELSVLGVAVSYDE